MKLAVASLAPLEPQHSTAEELDDADDGDREEAISGSYSVAASVSSILAREVPRAIVVIGPGQVVTAIVLRALGWHVELAVNVEEAARMAEAIDASALFVRISHSHLRSLRRPAHLTGSNNIVTSIVAIVDSADDTPLPGFDATIAVDDVDSLAAYVRSVAPTARAIQIA